MTKLPAVVCVLQLVERGLLTLDEDLRPRLKALAETQILRGFDDATGQPVYEENTTPISLRTLLTHTSGFAYDSTVESLVRWRKVTGHTKTHNTWTLESLRCPLVFTPGTQWFYGTSIDWATLALEQVTGQSLNEYATANIFEPLGMKNSFVGPANAAMSTEELLARLAPCPVRSADDGVLVPAELPHTIDDNNDVESGGAGLLSTARDYAQFLQAVLQPGKLLSAKNLALLFKPQLQGELLASLRATVAVPGYRVALAPEYADETPINVAFGGMLNLEDVPGKRPGGSLQWSGYLNSHWVSWFFLPPPPLVLGLSLFLAFLSGGLKSLIITLSSGSIPRTRSRPFCMSRFILLPTLSSSNCTMSSSVRFTGSSSRVNEHFVSKYYRSQLVALSHRGSFEKQQA